MDLNRMRDKHRRNQYLSNQIRIGLRYQLKALRDDRNLTQRDVAMLIGSTQSAVSRMEHNADKITPATLLKLAAVFDVGVVVRFEAMDSVVDWYDNLSPSKMAPRSSVSILAEMGCKED